MPIRDFTEFAGRYVENESTDGALVRHEGAGLDASDRLPNVLVKIIVSKQFISDGHAYSCVER
jgi:hypothetical protein